MTSRSSLFSFGLLLGLSACSGGGGGGGAADSVEQALNTLGVTTTATPRQAEPGVDVPASYSPLGATWRASIDELLVIGAATSTGSGLSLTDVTDDNLNAATTTLVTTQQTALPWPAEQRNNVAPPATMRAAVGADIDGDGHQEAVVVYQTSTQLHAYIVDDADAGHTVSDTLMQQSTGVTNVAVAAGDFDGDGVADLAVGLTRNGNGELTFFRWNGAGFVRFGPVRDLPLTLAGATLAIKLATGNLDYDRGDEIAVVVNERLGTFNATSVSRYAIFDDAAADFALLQTNTMVATGTRGTRLLATADVAIGDIDGDNLDEVVFGGLPVLQDACGNSPAYAAVALDDKVRGFASLGTETFDDSYSGCSNEVARLYCVHVRTLDLDGDGVKEIVINRRVFDDFAHAAPWTQVTAWRLPQAMIHPSNSGDLYDDSTSCMVVGDYDGDNRDDVACYFQQGNQVLVYGLAATATTIAQIRSFTATGGNSQTQINPILVGVDSKTDGPALRYSDGEYQLLFTRPVVIAALAAAPYRSGIGQNVDGCFTSFGNTQSTGTETERSVSFEVSATAGFKLDLGALTASELSVKETITRQATRTQGRAYTLAKTISFNAAPSEDTVVFTSVPVDRYVYTIVSHPDPTLIGRKVNVDLPRAPVLRQAERTFFNRTVPAGSVQIDGAVFAHTVGEPSSYPSRTQKDGLLGGSGLQAGPVGVPQGGGSTTLTLDVSNELTTGGGLEIGYQIDIEATAGASLRGVSIGTSSSRTWQIRSGTSTTYSGQVGGIPAATFAQNQYQWGLFAYVHTDASGAQFQVVDFWVE